jgi:hypothetical protein
MKRKWLSDGLHRYNDANFDLTSDNETRPTQIPIKTSVN